MTLWVFDDPPTVFIRIRKTGTTSVIKGVLGGRGNRTDTRDGEFLPEWRSRFVFGFVRNPFDRLVSCYEMFKNQPLQNPKAREVQEQLDLGRVMDIAVDDGIPLAGNGFVSRLRQHAIPATHPSYFLHEAEFIGRFESFERDCGTARSRLGLPPIERMPHKRQTAPRDYRSYFDARTRAQAEAVYAEDLAQFDYRF